MDAWRWSLGWNPLPRAAKGGEATWQGIPTPDVEVLERPVRRRFTAEYKADMLAAGGFAAFMDRPDDERLPAPRIAARSAST